MRIRLGEERDREEIYRVRHAVYACELGQHQENPEQRLWDALDESNIYLLAERGESIEGFISITPPERCRRPKALGYSIEKYLHRDSLPFALDRGVFEVRLLTVPKVKRGTKVPLLLMWAALRWVEHNKGSRIIGMGRRKLMPSYRKLGLQPTGIEIQSGAVAYEVMHATTASLREHLGRHGGRVQRLTADIEWQLSIPLNPPVGCYHGGAFFNAIGPRFEDLGRRHEVINADVLDAWYDPSPRVLQAIEEHLPWVLRTSPPTDCEGLVSTIAEVRGVDPSCLLPGSGSSHLIFLGLRRWLTPASRALILDPSYGEYAHVLEQVVGCRVNRLRLARGNHYDVDLHRLGELLAEGYDLVVLVNPNSPTGRHIRSDQLRALIVAAPPTTRFWIDETYVEYVGADESLERFAAAGANVVVCKSMSKVYALSGVRVGYLCGPADLISDLRAVNPPWPVSLPGQIAGVAALSDPAYYQGRFQETHRLREALAARLRAECGFDVIPAVANFLLCHLPPDGMDAQRLVELCRRARLFIRDTSTMGPSLGHHAVRLAVKDHLTNELMVEILSRALQTH